MMSRILHAHTAFPPHYYTQDQLIAAFRKQWGKKHFNLDRLEQFHRNVLVGGRHLALPIEAYDELNGFASSNDAYIGAALDLAEKMVAELLDSANIHAKDISLIASTTVTGIAVPSLEARLMNRLPFGTHTRRMPLFGLGCLGGAAGLSRVHDFLVGQADKAALLIAVELCSLTLQREDLSIANIVSSGLFGDGAAAVLLTGKDHAAAKHGPEIVDTISVFFPDTERVMGWDMVDSGFQVVLDNSVPAFAEEQLRPGIENLLARHNLSLSDVKHWIAHPGGPRVITAMEKGFGLPEGTLDPSRQSLQELGNLSSVSVLNILQRTLEADQAQSGDYGILLAMGPAFCAEALLLRW